MQAAFNKMILMAAIALSSLSTRIANNDITAKQFLALFLLLLLQFHTEAATVGRLHADVDIDPGTDPTRFESHIDRNAAHAAVTLQKPFAENFADDILEGKYSEVVDVDPITGEPVDGPNSILTLKVDAITKRALMYLVALSVTANRAWAAHLPDGLTFDWVLGDEGIHCDVCPERASKGPYTIDTLPGYPRDGSTPCLIFCKCRLRTSDGRLGLTIPDTDGEGGITAVNDMPNKNNTAIQPEYKVFAFKGDSLNGNTFAGNGAGIGNLDLGEDVVFPKSFTKALVAFHLRGFVPTDHDWSWKSMIAMPLLCEERGSFLYFEGEFHSTQDAQDARTKAKERMDRGLWCGLSIGYMLAADGFKLFPNGKTLLAWAKANGYDMTLFDVDTISAYNSTIRGIIEVAELAEISFTPAPMNQAAGLTAVKNQVTNMANKNGQKYMGGAGFWCEGFVENTAADATCAALNVIYYELCDSVYEVLYSVSTVAEMVTMLQSEYTTFNLRSMAIIEAVMTALAPTEGTDAKSRAEVAGAILWGMKGRIPISFSLKTDHLTPEQLVAFKTKWATVNGTTEGSPINLTQAAKYYMDSVGSYSPTTEHAMCMAACGEATKAMYESVGKTLRKADEFDSLDDCMDECANHMDQHKALCMAAIKSISSTAASMSDGAKSLQLLSLNSAYDMGDLVDGLPLSQFSGVVVDASQELARRVKAQHDQRVKDGRKLSQETRSKLALQVQAHKDCLSELEALMSDVDAVNTTTEPPADSIIPPSINQASVQQLHAKAMQRKLAARSPVLVN